MLENEKGFTYTWEIDNFSLLPHQKGELLQSPIFVIDTWKELKWTLMLYPKGRLLGKKDEYMSLYLCNSPEDLRIDLLEFEFSVTLVSSEPSSSITWSIENFKRLQYHDAEYFIKLSDIFEKKHLFLPQDTLTLRCQFSPIEHISRESAVYEESAFKKSFRSRSCLFAHRRSITLQVRFIKELRNRLGNASFALETAFIKAVSLNITLHFSKTDCVQIEIRQTNLQFIERLFVKCKMTVISAHKDYQHSKESTHLFQRSLDDIWHFPDFLVASNLTRDKYLYLDDTLLLQCEFAFTCISSTEISEINYMPLTFEKKEDRGVSELATYLKELYISEKSCDIDVRPGDETFPVHKDFMSAISPVLISIFENKSKEHDSSVIEKKDEDSDTLRRRLATIDSDSLKEDLSLENASKLFSDAVKFGIESLRRRCAILLVSSLSVANVCDVLVLADTHEDNFLLTAVHNFIFSHTNEIFFSDHWEKFMVINPKLSGEIMHQMWMKKGHF